MEFYDDNAVILHYRILESPLPVENYVASVTVMNIDDSVTEVVWQLPFNAVNVSDEEVKE